MQLIRAKLLFVVALQNQDDYEKCSFNADALVLQVMEQNQDALEYSSEDESKKKGESLSEALGKLKEKGKKDLSKVDHTEIKYPDFR